ncbi:hypothetical protein Dred_0829 [Desulforamulus reducens MI-1]|uniref:Prepilin type IV endopeptidase peptidase domain-containing protein n=1 Tax=Desulforamulus reducens (strain ATCC BAA-1160 / DSM 100696 / MI-1) TaxID=349161 RepID=A4J2R4_DESRM|nr:prepilin peptidase [Desulforamulus reducens]ABO49367.1 hypothetical protein Dred_0829 [Desulforamulus reducens MI-1]
MVFLGFDMLVGVLVVGGCLKDIWHRVIPKWCTVGIFLLAVTVNILKFGWLSGIINTLTGALFLTSMYLMLGVMFKQRLGGGDWKLIIALGAYVGWNDMSGLLPIQLFFAGIMELLHFAVRSKAILPWSFVMAFKDRLIAELYGYADPVVYAYGPFIGLPFIFFLLLKNYLLFLI